MHVHIIQHTHKLLIAGIITIGILCIGSLGIGIYLEILRHSNNSSPSSSPTGGAPESLPAEDIPDEHDTLHESSDPQLRLLAAYEERLGRGFDSTILFADIPATNQDASAQASNMATVLKEYARQHVKPVVIFEPEGLDLRSLDRSVFQAYFTALKAQGITDQEIGVWAPFPEPNIPEWGSPADDVGNTDPQLFVKNFTMLVSSLKEQFTDAETLVLLDSATYPSHDIAYQHGSYAAEKLLEYVQDLDRDLVDAVGLQGFPWGEQGGELNYDPAVFLDADRAIALAKAADVKEVWLNSGTFSSMYDWDPALRIAVTHSKRERILSGIIRQAEQVRKAGLQVTVSIFAEDKSATEANWSYKDPAAWNVLQAFVHRAEDKGIGLTVFDLPKDL
jgi:hypothetical protein